ncbi:MAG: hypothetical protein K2N32_00870 [Clostridia bacterium]|nr:hypothetical protein [Clostridia bacterium]
MKTKLGWILFSIMTVIVIVLSSILVSYNVRWKSGDELLDIDIEDIESIYISAIDGLKPNLPSKEYYMSEEQIDYILKEFKSSKFERDNEDYCGGSVGVHIQTTDGRSIVISVYARYIYINYKQYICHSYFTDYVRSFTYWGSP